MDPITLAAIGLKLKGFFGAIFKSKWFWIALAVTALVVGGTIAFKHYVSTKVETAVTDDRKDATIDTYKAADKVNTAVAPIDRKYDAIKTQATKDYANVRSTIQAAPEDQRSAPAPDLIIDTLNALSGMRHDAAEPNGVPDPARPVG